MLPEGLWKNVFVHSPVPLSLIHPDGRMIAASESYAAMLGYRRDVVEQLDVNAVTRSEDQSWTANYLHRLVEGEVPQYVTEKLYTRSDGTELLARLHASPILDDDGECVAVLGAITPMEERGRVDDARLRSVLAHSEATVTIVDRNGAVLEATGRYQPVLGYPTAFWETRSMFDLLAPGQLHKVLAFREQLTSVPRQRMGIEVTVLSADGTPHQLLLQATNLLDDPEVNGIVLTSLDITEQRRIEAELRLRSDTAEAVAEAQKLLLATVSHELRNPLHALQGLAELLASSALPTEAAELATRLARQLTGLASVTQDLLDTARLDAGAVELKPVPTELRELVADAVDYGRTAAGNDEITVEGTVGPDVPTWVSADAPRLRQILRNLVGNAVKFTPRGAIVVDVRSLGPASADSVVSISVRDSGVGIPAEELDRILAPFQTGSTAGTGRGSGLGLAIVHRLVTAMGGELHVSSELERGTTFRVDLPLPRVAAPAKVVRTVEPSGTRVLVVEDNPVNQQLARSQLDRLGMTATIVGSGEEALALLGRADRPEFDVVLMDHQLPGLDGVETMQAMRTMAPEVASLPVVCLTASASTSQRNAYLEAGMDGFIAKPATLDDIRAAIAEVLTTRRSGLASTDVAAAAAAVAVPAGAPAVFDEEVLDRLIGELEDREVVESMVDAYLGELDARRGSLLDALDAGQADAAAKAAHTLKSSSRLLGGAALGALCQAIEHREPVERSVLVQLIDDTAEAMRAWRGRSSG